MYEPSNCKISPWVALETSPAIRSDISVRFPSENSHQIILDKLA